MKQVGIYNLHSLWSSSYRHLCWIQKRDSNKVSFVYDIQIDPWLLARFIFGLLYTPWRLPCNLLHLVVIPAALLPFGHASILTDFVDLSKAGMTAFHEWNYRYHCYCFRIGAFSLPWSMAIVKMISTSIPIEKVSTLLLCTQRLNLQRKSPQAIVFFALWPGGTCIP